MSWLVCGAIVCLLFLVAEWKGGLIRSAIGEEELKWPVRGESEGERLCPLFGLGELAASSGGRFK